MTNRQKRELQRDFFRKAGPNIEVFRQMFDHVPDTKFFIIDDKDRIITFNRQNLENGNFKDETEVVGKTCAEIFPAPFAKVYMDPSPAVNTRRGINLLQHSVLPIETPQMQL